MIRIAVIGVWAVVAFSCARRSSVEPIAPTPARVSPSAPLLPAAQKALDEGIAAANRQDYVLAIRHFNEARKLAPGAAVVYFNLGVAESRLPARELRAVAWFAAYLAAYPDAPDAVSVEQEIEMLEARNRAAISRLISGEQDMIKEMVGWSLNYDHANALEELAELYASVGDSASVRAVVIAANDAFVVGGFRQVASLASVAPAEAKARTALARAQLKSGDVAGARETLTATRELIRLMRDWQKIDAAIALGNAQKSAGDVAAALDAFTIAEAEADGIKDPSERSKHLMAIATARFRTEAARGLETFERAITAALKISDASTRDGKLSDLALRRAEVGDLAGARKTAGFLEQSWPKNFAQSAIAKAEGRAGDFASALKTASFLPADYRSETQSALATLALDAGDTTRAREILAVALKSAHQGDPRCCKSSSLILAAGVQSKIGDIAGATRTLRSAKKAADEVEWNDGGGIISEGGRRRGAQLEVARAQAELLVPPDPAHDWLVTLDETDPERPCPLNTAPFLDLSRYLKQLPRSDDPRTSVKALHTMTTRLIRASSTVREMRQEKAEALHSKHRASGR